MPTTDIDMKHCKGCNFKYISGDSLEPNITHTLGTIEHPIKTPDTFEEKKITQIDTIFPHLSQQRIDGIGFSFAREAAQNTRNEIIEFLRTTIAEARAQERDRFKKHLQIMIDKNVDMDFKTLDYKGLSNDILQYKNEDLTLP